MPTELVEVDHVLDHPADQVWELLGDPALYPRFVREVAACDPAGEGAPSGRGARYRVRYAPHRGQDPVLDELAVLVHCPGEHLVLVGPAWQGGHLSVRLTAESRRRTRVQVVLSLPETLTAGTVLTSAWLRKRIRRAFGLIDHQLAGRGAAAPRGRAEATARGAGSVTTLRVLTKAGVIAPGRPDRLARQLATVAKWGATLVGGYRAAAVAAPRALAIVDENGEHTYADLDRRSTRLANALAERGVRAGRRVALMCRNHAGLVTAAIACGKLGADVLMLNTGLSADQVADTVERHRPVALLADDEFAPLFHHLPPALRYISTWSAAPADLTLDTLVATGAPTPITAPRTPGRVIVLTSGTTGAPKGARRRNPPGLSAAASVLSRIPLRVGERMLVATPLFHTWGLAAMQLATPLQASLVLQRRFDPEAALAAIAERRCTSMVAVPIMLQRILALPARVRARYDTSSLRVVASSGAPLPGALVTAFMDAFGDILYNLYGSTEVSWASIADPADLRAAPTTAGRCPAGTKVGILDAAGRPLPPGVVGRIAVGNEMLFEGYTDGGSPEKHGDLMVTGDRGYLDADGRLFVSGRDDDMIVSGGENVFPRPVEELLLSLEQVVDAAVVGVPDRDYGQRFAAFVVLKPGARMQATEVQEFVHAHLERYSVPRDVVFVSKVPRNATGKVVKDLLVEQV
ncbi:AMP-binding protein [Actinokineospora sp. NPDC004072]